MPTKQQPKQQADHQKQERQRLNAVVGKQVLHTLGQPGNLLRVQVSPLWDNHYRVNIYIGADIASARIATSYFLVADGDGNIVESIPPITKQY